MPKDCRLKDRTGEKSIQAFLQEKRIQQQQAALQRRLQQTRDARLRAIDAESSVLRETLESYGRGMTSLSSYFEKEKSDPSKGFIWFPLERTYTDWEPRPCWLGKHAVNKDRCVHFPCRTMTSYHFIFRNLPDWVLQQAEESVRRSKLRPTEVQRKKHTVIHRMKGTKINIDPPKLEFPANITEKERKLKIFISKKRLMNEIENKPSDRNISYGKPTPVGRLQRPVRPVVRRMEVRS